MEQIETKIGAEGSVGGCRYAIDNSAKSITVWSMLCTFLGGLLEDGSLIDMVL